jgi:hypothetical protein
MANRHKYPPLSFRPAQESDRVWVVGYAERIGQPLNRVLAEALALFRATKEDGNDHRSDRPG